METFACVRPEHLNQHGHLFGGQILLWADEFAWMAAARDFPGCRFVTVAFDHSAFRQPAPLGALLRFEMKMDGRGRTSVHYAVTIHATPPGGTAETLIFTTRVSFVRVDDDGNKTPLPDA